MFDRWSKETAAVWVRAGFRCEYCDCDLLADHSKYRLADVDHILPKSRFGEPSSTLGLALCCRYCNLLKLTDVVGDEEQWRLLQSGDDEARTVLIAAFRELLTKKRAVYDEKIRRLRDVIHAELA